jgi:periplasmic protein TonB
MQQKALFSDAFLYQPSIFKRLAAGFSEASDEFRKNPKGFVVGAVKGDGVGGRLRQDRLMLGFAVAMFVFAVIIASMLIAFWIKHRNDGLPQEELAVVDYKLTDIAPVDLPKAEKRAGGGGGGGRQAPTPPSKGVLPKQTTTPPMIAPRPEPQLKPPSLPVQETIQMQQVTQPPPVSALIGDPKGVPGPPSPGPGTGGGIGTGDKGGIGSGNGTGYGPGEGFNTGGGRPGVGGGDRNAVATAVDQRPRALNNPQPRYTEEARKNKIQGTVIARVLVGADGTVKQVRITRGLPDGLDEQAIQAAYQIRFQPAMKSGQPVAFWQAVSIEFNLR